jgi:hypothetical protein
MREFIKKNYVYFIISISFLWFFWAAWEILNILLINIPFLKQLQYQITEISSSQDLKTKFFSAFIIFVAKLLWAMLPLYMFIAFLSIQNSKKNSLLGKFFDGIKEALSQQILFVILFAIYALGVLCFLYFEGFLSIFSILIPICVFLFYMIKFIFNK